MKLLADDVLEVPDRVEDLSDRERGRGVLADQAQRFLVLGRGAVLEPEQVVRLQVLSQSGGLDRRHPVVSVVQERDVGTELVAHRLEHTGQMVQVGARVPVLLDRLRAASGRFMVVPGLAAAGVG